MLARIWEIEDQAGDAEKVEAQITKQFKQQSTELSLDDTNSVISPKYDLDSESEEPNFPWNRLHTLPKRN